MLNRPPEEQLASPLARTQDTPAPTTTDPDSQVLSYGQGNSTPGIIERTWDVIVGSIMIVSSLIVQAVVIFFVFGLSFAGAASYLGLRETWVFIGEGITAILLNWLTWRTFKHQHQARRTLGLGSAFFLLPRGIYRIRFGRETFHQMEES